MTNSVVVDYQAKVAEFITDTGRAARAHQKAMKEMADQALEFAKVIGIAYSIEQIVEFANRIASFGHEMEEMGQKVGMSAGELSALKVVADQAGLSMEQMQSSVDKFSKNAVAAQAGAKLQAAQFKALGINIDDANGHLKPTSQLLDETAKKFASFRDSNIKTADAMALFGKAGADLIPFLNRLGKEGMDGATEQAKAFGTYLGGDAIRASEEYRQQTIKLHEIVDGFGMLLVNIVTPALTALIGEFTDYISATGKAEDRTAGLKEDVKDVAGGFIVFVSWVQKATAEIGAFADRIGAIGTLIANTPFKRIAEDEASMAANPLPWKKWAAAEDLKAAIDEQKQHLADGQKAWDATNKALHASITAINSERDKSIGLLIDPPKVAANDDKPSGDKDATVLPVGGGVHRAHAAMSGLAEATKAFASYIDGLTAKTFDTGDKALDEYAKGVDELNKHMQDFIDKGGRAAAAGAGFTKGQAALLQKLNQDEADAAKKRQAEIDAYNDSLQSQLADQKSAVALQVQAVGMGAKEADLARQLNDIRTSGDKAVAALEKSLAAASIQGEKDKYQAEIDLATKFTADQIALAKKGAAAMDEAQSHWQNGARSALQDFQDQSKNIAGQVHDIWANALNGITDAITNLITTGKGGFKALADSIAQSITHMIVQTQVAKLTASDGPLGGLFGKIGLGGADYGAGAAAAQTAATTANTAALMALTATMAANDALGGLGGSGGAGGFLSNLFSSGGTSSTGAGIIGSIQDLFPGFAAGGSVMGGSPIIVGERGPELFVPKGSGTIVPNSRIGSGGSPSVTQYITVQGSMTQRTAQQLAQESQIKQNRAMGRNR